MDPKIKNNEPQKEKLSTYNVVYVSPTKVREIYGNI